MRLLLIPILLLAGLPLTMAAPLEGAAISVAKEVQAIQDLQSRGEYSEALSRASRLVTRNPSALEAHVTYQEVRLARGERADLLDIYAERMKREGATADDLFLHARLLDGNRRQRALKAALKLDGRHFWSLNALGADYVAEGKGREARKYLEEARAVRPESAIPINSLAWLSEAEGDVKRAEELYQAAVELEPGYLVPRVNLGLLLVGQGRSSEGEPILAGVLEADPRNPLALIGMGMVRALEGDSKGALARYEEALQLSGKNVTTLNLVGTAYLGLGQNDLAKQVFDQALELDPESVSTLLNQTVLALAKGSADQAMTWAERALKLESRNSQAWYFYGLALEWSGKIKAAEKAYDKAIDFDPENPNYVRALAVLAAGNGRWADAIRAYLKVAELSGRSVDSLLDLAFGYVGAGDAKQAVAFFDEVIERDPDNLVAWMNLGLLFHEQLREPEKAIAAYEEYLSRGGNDTRVVEWLADLRKR